MESAGAGGSNIVRGKRLLLHWDASNNLHYLASERHRLDG